MPDIVILNIADGNRLTLRLSDRRRNFTLQTERISAAALRDLDPVAKDFLEIAAAVFYADSEIRRGGDTRPNMGRNWRRHLRISVPVRQPGLWSRPEVRSSLTDTVRFMTDDEVEFAFAAYGHEAPAEGFLDLDPEGAAFSADEVILFSGGLDSFAGALEALSTNSGKVLLVSHRSANKVAHRQDELAAWLSKRFPGRVQHVKVGATRAGSESHDTTQRSRSLLFAAIGHAVAQAFGSKRLSFYENGIVSHNLPINPQVVGTMATRTTHPGTIDLLNRLVALIASDTTRISNPYAWLTKRQVVERIAQYDGAAMIGTAVSCTHVRDQTTLHTHCGWCSQCLDRRFAILAAGLQAHDPAESYATDVLFGARDDTPSRTLAVEWTRHALRLGQIGEAEFLQSFGMSVSQAMQTVPPDQQESHFRSIVAMHRRHGAAVEAVLQRAMADNARDLTRKALPASGLVRLWLSDPSESPGGAISALAAPAPTWWPVDMDEGGDALPSPDGPWTARFFREDDDLVVTVDRWGRVKGAPALVAHLLKNVWLEDQDKALQPKDHRFVHLHALPGVTFSKNTATANVSRCRKMLAADYETMFGAPHAGDLLIESGGKKGHRLDPTTRVIDEA